MAEYIYEIKNNLHPDVCKYIIDKFEQDENKAPGRTASNNHNVNVIRPEIKSSTDLKINPSFKVWKDVHKYLHERLQDGAYEYMNYLKKMWIDHDNSIANPDVINSIVFFNQDTGYQIQRVSKGQYYVYHSDWDPIGTRSIAYIWYLNDMNSEDGGTTDFLCQKVKINPEEGKLILFPATWTYIHKGSEVLTDNTKYIITGFLTYD